MSLLESNGQNLVLESGMKGYSGFIGVSESYPSELKREALASVDVIRQRSTPDVLIIGHRDEILFLSRTKGSPLALLNNDQVTSKDFETARRLKVLLSGLRELVLSRERLPVIERPIASPTVLFPYCGSVVSFRGLLLNGTGETQHLVMVLVEKVKHSQRVPATSTSSPYFTPREKSVLFYIRKGYTNKEIACALDIGVHTVKDHLKRIMSKVGVHTRAGIVGKLDAE